MFRCLLALAALVATWPLSGPLSAQPLNADETARIDQLVTKSLTESGVPSASIAVVRDGKLVLAKAYGTASEAIPVARADLPYQIASNSKQFTAAALLLLEDDGKLSLDDKVAKYIPGISGGDRIALRQLLNHTSGLQDYWPQDYSFAAMSRPITPQGIVNIWAKKPLDFEPGTQWQYSNTGYVVAGMIVDKVAGIPLLEFLKRRIFNPLRMSSVEELDRTNGPRFPQGYERYALGPVRAVTPAAPGWLYAAGDLSMSAADLAKWDIARLDRTVLPNEDWEAQETAVKLNDGKESSYGLGVFVRTSGGRPVIAHGGESVGFLSTNTVYPKERAAIVVLTNSWSRSAYNEISRGIAKIVLPPPPQDPVTLVATARIRTVFDQLRSGRLDRRLLTTNANYYFSRNVQADYHSSLEPLGEPTAFAPDGTSALRGGFIGQTYKVTYPNRVLSISTFAEPGPAGRIEQFLVTPGE